MKNIDKKLCRAVSEIIAEDVTLDTNLTDLDSSEQVECIIKLEEIFSIQITDDFAEEYSYKLQTVRDLKTMLKEKYNIVDVKEVRKEKLEKINESNLPN
jgi:acyl carrier protein